MASPVITPVERPPATGPQAARPTPPRIEALEEPAALEALEEPWRRLFDGCLDATPFQSPDWLLPWTRRFLSGRLYCLAAWRKSALVGLAPMAIEPRPEGRTLTPLGGSITDYQGALIAPDAAGDGVVSALVAELVRAGARWDQCDFDHLRGGDPFCTFPFPAAYAEELAARSPCPYVRLPARPGDLLRALPGRLGPRLERCLRGLSRQGEVELVRASDRTIEKLLRGLFRLHAARWNTRGQPGLLSSRALEAFHREVSDRLLRRRALRLYALKVGGTLAAAVYGFSHRRRFYSYIGGFDPALAKWSPGLVSIWQAMRASIEEGIEEFDFLRGAEPYKFRFGTEVRWTFRRRVRLV